MKAISPYVEIMDELDRQDILNILSDPTANNVSLHSFQIAVIFVIDNQIMKHLPMLAPNQMKQLELEFLDDVEFILPYFLKYKSAGWDTWQSLMGMAEKSYFKLIELGYSPNQANSILPQCTKKQVLVTLNLQQWKEYISHGMKSLHPSANNLCNDLLETFKELVPLLFDDITW